jgi:hypothetical protein
MLYQIGGQIAPITTCVSQQGQVLLIRENKVYNKAMMKVQVQDLSKTYDKQKIIHTMATKALHHKT